MNAVSRFDANRKKQWRGLRGLPTWAQPTLYTAGALVAAFFIFQLFFRYQYLETNGALWRVDRLTQQTCQVNIGQARCATSPPTHPTISTSVSTSTSLSTSVSLKPALPKHKH